MATIKNIVGQITLEVLKEVSSTTYYYLLQPSTAAAPSKPTTNPPTGWNTTEPSYVTGDTRDLYVTVQTIYSDGTFDYTTPSLSSSYEAAKQAYNRAQSAFQLASDTGNYFWTLSSKYSDDIPAGSYVSGKQKNIFLSEPTGVGNVLVQSTGLTIRNGLDALSSFTSSALNFYRPKQNSSQTDAERLAMSLSGTDLRFYSSGITDGQALLDPDAVLNSEGLTLKKGGLKFGQKEENDYVYLSTTDHPVGEDGITIGGYTPTSETSKWRQVIGNKFGVTSEGQLYATDTNLTRLVLRDEVKSVDPMGAIYDKSQVSSFTAKEWEDVVRTVYGGINVQVLCSTEGSETEQTTEDIELIVDTDLLIERFSEIVWEKADQSGDIDNNNSTSETSETPEEPDLARYDKGNIITDDNDVFILPKFQVSAIDDTSEAPDITWQYSGTIAFSFIDSSSTTGSNVTLITQNTDDINLAKFGITINNPQYITQNHVITVLFTETSGAISDINTSLQRIVSTNEELDRLSGNVNTNTGNIDLLTTAIKINRNDPSITLLTTELKNEGASTELALQSSALTLSTKSQNNITSQLRLGSNSLSLFNYKDNVPANGIEMTTEQLNLVDETGSTNTWLKSGNLYSKNIYCTQLVPRVYEVDTNSEVKIYGQIGWIARNNGHLSLKLIGLTDGETTEQQEGE